MKKAFLVILASIYLGGCATEPFDEDAEQFTCEAIAESNALEPLDEVDAEIKDILSSQVQEDTDIVEPLTSIDTETTNSFETILMKIDGSTFNKCRNGVCYKQN